MNSIILRVTGMTCSSCERRVETAAAGVPGVTSARAEASKERLVVDTAPGADRAETTAAVARAVEAAGYAARALDDRARRRVSPDMLWSLVAGAGLAAVFFALDHSGLIAFAPRQGASIAALFASGLLTSFHCISMCGGIALSQALRAGSAATSRKEALRPSIAYNAGRVVGYTVIGAAVGALGSALDLGARGRGLVMLAAALFMVFMGLRLAGLVPAAKRREGSAYGRLRDALGSKAAGLGPFAVGLANALMPCGPLQAAQAFALASGSALTGAASMFAFSAGTVPLMLAFGAGGAFLSARFRAIASRAGGILVLSLGLAALGRAMALSGVALPVLFAARGGAAGQALTSGEDPARSAAPAPRAGGPASVAPQSAQPGGSGQAAARTSAVQGFAATLREGYQEVSFDLSPRAYGRIYVAAGVPVRWTIRAAASSINGCNNALVVPAYGLKKELVPGDNLIEFTPGQPGIVPYSCWMGMIRSTIEVVAPDDPRLSPRS